MQARESKDQATTSSTDRTNSYIRTRCGWKVVPPKLLSLGEESRIFREQTFILRISSFHEKGGDHTDDGTEQLYEDSHFSECIEVNLHSQIDPLLRAVLLGSGHDVARRVAVREA